MFFLFWGATQPNSNKHLDPQLKTLAVGVNLKKNYTGLVPHLIM